MRRHRSRRGGPRGAEGCQQPRPGPLFDRDHRFGHLRPVQLEPVCDDENGWACGLPGISCCNGAIHDPDRSLVLELGGRRQSSARHLDHWRQQEILDHSTLSGRQLELRHLLCRSDVDGRRRSNYDQVRVTSNHLRAGTLHAGGGLGEVRERGPAGVHGGGVPGRVRARGRRRRAYPWAPRPQLCSSSWAGGVWLQCNEKHISEAAGQGYGSLGRAYCNDDLVPGRPDDVADRRRRPPDMRCFGVGDRGTSGLPVAGLTGVPPLGVGSRCFRVLHTVVHELGRAGGYGNPE
mmetsp:Transcript_13366/g.35463  ORF Transcript_13366/g.35463 Transcript_13366/m.35463 type:complete len:291 (+) Transcript_13366:142-1014(+)